MDEEIDDVTWTGCARVDPAAVFVVGDVAVTAAELARWVKRQKEQETNWMPSWQFDALLLGVIALSCVSLVYLAAVR